MLTDFCIKNYRSIRDVWLKLKRVNVFVGPNGSGKSNLYRAMYLLASTASGQLARNIGEEGGMGSVMWGGEYGKYDKRVTFLSARIDNLQYDLALGIIPETLCPSSLFASDLEVKRELVVSIKADGVRSSFLNRGRNEVKARDHSGVTSDYTLRIESNESILTGLREPHKYPILSNLRQEFLNWRFYHHFRTDRQSPLRKPQLAIFTPVMAHDGSDFVSALGSIFASEENEPYLLESLEQAFPGSHLSIQPTENGKLKLSMSFPDINRKLDAAELSDGTLQYLCLLASVFSLRPPSVLAINEPETSIHPSLFEPMAKMLRHASRDSQIWITTHSREFADLMLEYTGCSIWELEKVEGETRLVDVGLGGYKEEDEYEELPG